MNPTRSALAAVALVAALVAPAFANAQPLPAPTPTPLAPATEAPQMGPAPATVPPQMAPAPSPSAAAQHAAPEPQALPSPSGSPAPTPSPSPIPTATASPWAFVFMVPRPTPPASPQPVGLPVIYEFDLNAEPIVTPGELRGRILTSPDVVDVVISMLGRDQYVPKTAPGVFEAVAQVPSIPFFAAPFIKGKRDLQITANGPDHKSTTITVPVHIK